ncbi:sialic acid-binding Ig-like lectin 6 isoform X2 [Theropithecus gelada]|uniref:sialic acid-binding Ig-like lectin 6 isoform X2 n=1 Tax=Theropithecus gelada TaxID=9565 RepID=UPI000DC17C89|nr:sialic acid-binding Ig-like lectin 6 isoform X2 [Theropithecus gelada]
MLPLLLLLLWAGALAQEQRFRLEGPESLTVQEGLCVLLPCRLPPIYSLRYIYYGYWFLEGADVPVATNDPHEEVQEETRGRFHLLWDLSSKNCSLRIRDARRRDTAVYFFQLKQKWPNFGYTSYVSSKLSVCVLALTHRPSISIPGTLESGCSRTLNCSVPWACEQGTPPIFSWMSAAPTSLGPRTTQSSVLTITPRPQDHSTNLTCQVTFPGVGVTMERTIQLNVSSLKILQNTSSLPVLEGQALRLLCDADGNPPAHLSWFQGFPALNATPISNTGVLELSQVGSAEEGGFTCRAQHPLGSLQISLSLFVQWKPEGGVGGVLGAVWGAGTTALVFLCVGFIFRVKTRRKKAAQSVQNMDDVNPVMVSGSRGHQHQFQRGIVSDHPAEADPVSGDEQELHYAFLRFHKVQLQEPEVTNTEYSEIKIRK